MASAVAVVWMFFVFAALTGLACFIISAPWGKISPNNRGVGYAMAVATGMCLYLMWAICYLAQANPLIAPQRTGWIGPGISP
ncbi:hypothetical protein H696_00990 [Fonticula alba]|uniref:V-type H+-transporting ATPase subunit H n=1 Tax=Fonticula alba TaxID=691883 RepID=A0A058ZHM6_FONAL|nr:hypothetical protein H696_00990 [Fonticula alba]KCV73456.1 hypothetical protein H696_00990 [Fonticula alba]|eukprot:XP_009493157.1 hypothetical protein H696_00990 [Fonticula alba]